MDTVINSAVFRAAVVALFAFLLWYSPVQATGPKSAVTPVEVNVASNAAIAAATPTPEGTGQLRVSPVLLNLRLDPGKKYTYDITLDNLTDQPLPVKLSFDSIDTDDESGDIRLDGPVSPLLSWSEVTPDSLIIDAGGRRTVRVTVQIPDTVALGGYYGVLFVEPLFRSSGPGSQVSGKVGIPILTNISVGETQRKASITDWSTPDAVGDRQKVAFTLRLRNSGLNHFTGTPRILLQQWLGEPNTIVLDERVVFPGKSRVWKSTVDMAQFSYGIYSATAIVSVGNGETIQASTTIVSLPFIPIATGAVIVCVALFLWYRRKRLKRVFLILKGSS
ncbi:MAG: DUF916 domain-containing protein [Patescibacteria group bacterium]|nr:DUF916 domain-containing protein [Patescibacteria group bacterium]